MLHNLKEEHGSFLGINLHGNTHHKDLRPYHHGNDYENNNNAIVRGNDRTDKHTAFHMIGDRTNKLVDELRKFSFKSPMMKDLISKLLDTNCERHLALVRVNATCFAIASNHLSMYICL